MMETKVWKQKSMETYRNKTISTWELCHGTGQLLDRIPPKTGIKGATGKNDSFEAQLLFTQN